RATPTTKFLSARSQTMHLTIQKDCKNASRDCQTWLAAYIERSSSSICPSKPVRPAGADAVGAVQVVGQLRMRPGWPGPAHAERVPRSHSGAVPRLGTGESTIESAEMMTLSAAVSSPPAAPATRGLSFRARLVLGVCGLVLFTGTIVLWLTNR